METKIAVGLVMACFGLLFCTSKNTMPAAIILMVGSVLLLIGAFPSVVAGG